MKAPRLKVSSFYFGLLTAIKCDTGHKNRESGLKVTCLHLVLTVQEAVQAGMSHPCSKATGSQKAGGKEITAAEICSLILQSCSNNPRLRNTAAGTTVAMPQSALGLSFLDCQF